MEWYTRLHEIFMIHLSATILVRADTSVEECVRLMNENQTSAVLITGDDADGSLVGIFTGQDLIRKIDLIQKGEHWLRPIRTVMTTPVITVEASEIDQAYKMMIDHSLRQIPVIDSKSSSTKILGFITLSDLFLKLYNEKPQKLSEDQQNENPSQSTPATLSNKDKSKLRVSLITEDRFFSKFMIEFIAKVIPVKMKRIHLDEGRFTATELLVLDIDGFQNKNWLQYLKEINQNTVLSLIMITYNPNRHNHETIISLEKLAKTKKFWIFRKPVEIHEIITKIQKQLNSHPR